LSRANGILFLLHFGISLISTVNVSWSPLDLSTA
jgi:hypothetical protein